MSMNIKADSFTHYFASAYDDKSRFVSYFHQIIELKNLAPSEILEIGTGNKLVYRYLKERGVSVTSVDIDPALKPDVVASVLDLPFSDASFDVIACYEVLEHMPFDQVPQALVQIHRVCARASVISLPDCSPVFRCFLHSPVRTLFRRLIPVPGFIARLLYRPAQTVDKADHRTYHHWEIGRDGVTASQVTGLFKQAGFTVTKSYRIFENPYHHFFVLAKKNTYS